MTTRLDDEKHVQTARDGTYSLQGVLGLPDQHYIPPVTYTKDGYVTQQFVRTEVGKDALVILERQVALEGQVLGPDGQPVKSFAVCAGPDGASPYYLSVKSVERIITDTAGRFKLWLDRPARPGWASVPKVSRAGRVRPTFRARVALWSWRMESGVSVTGRIMAPLGAYVKLQARLIPRRPVRRPGFPLQFGSDRLVFPQHNCRNRWSLSLRTCSARSLQTRPRRPERHFKAARIRCARNWP